MTGHELPRRMKAARVLEFGKTEYSIEETDVPTPKGFEYLLKIEAAGYCHTDAMVANGEFASKGAKCPITGSHEPTGKIVAMGSEAEKAGKDKIGDRVGAFAMKGVCGKCPDCKVWGDSTYCTAMEGMVGVTTNGGFAEYCIVDSRSTAAIPDSMSSEQAAPLMCAGLTIYTAIRKAEKHGLKAGGVVGFVGLGALGTLGVQFAKVMGYKVVGVDARKEPIELTRSLKYPPDLIFHAQETKAEDALKQIKDLAPEKPFEGLDATILLADPQQSVDYGVALTARHGLVVLVSQPADGITIQFDDLVFRDIRIVGSLLGTQQGLQETLDLCAKHGIESSLSLFKLEDVNEAVKTNASETKKGKTVVSFSSKI